MITVTVSESKKFKISCEPPTGLGQRQPTAMVGARTTMPRRMARRRTPAPCARTGELRPVAIGVQQRAGWVDALERGSVLSCQGGGVEKDAARARPFGHALAVIAYVGRRDKLS